MADIRDSVAVQNSSLKAMIAEVNTTVAESARRVGVEVERVRETLTRVNKSILNKVNRLEVKAAEQTAEISFLNPKLEDQRVWYILNFTGSRLLEISLPEVDYRKFVTGSSLCYNMIFPVLNA